MRACMHVRVSAYVGVWHCGDPNPVPFFFIRSIGKSPLVCGGSQCSVGYVETIELQKVIQPAMCSVACTCVTEVCPALPLVDTKFTLDGHYPSFAKSFISLLSVKLWRSSHCCSELWKWTKGCVSPFSRWLVLSSHPNLNKHEQSQQKYGVSGDLNFSPGKE